MKQITNRDRHPARIVVSEAAANRGPWRMTILMSDGTIYAQGIDTLDLLDNYVEFAGLTSDDVCYLGRSRSQLCSAIGS